MVRTNPAIFSASSGESVGSRRRCSLIASGVLTDLVIGLRKRSGGSPSHSTIRRKVPGAGVGPCSTLERVATGTPHCALTSRRLRPLSARRCENKGARSSSGSEAPCSINETSGDHCPVSCYSHQRDRQLSLHRFIVTDRRAL